MGIYNPIKCTMEFPDLMVFSSNGYYIFIESHR